MERIWMAWRTDDHGPGTPCADEPTAKAYAVRVYSEGQHPDDMEDARLTWIRAWWNEEDGHDGGSESWELNDKGTDTGWCISPETIVTAEDRVL